MIKLSKKTLAILIIVVLSPVLVPLLFLAGSALMAGVYWLFGYYVNIPGWRMGQIAAEKESVEECELLRKTWYFGGFDSGDMHRSECIHTYASSTQPPANFFSRAITGGAVWGRWLVHYLMANLAGILSLKTTCTAIKISVKVN